MSTLDSATSDSATPSPSAPNLTPTSYIVLGLVKNCQPATPYDLKKFAELSTSNFWTVPHTQLYSECARLAEAGLLDEQREETGRRRRIYRLTTAGQDALSAWLAKPAGQLTELRDLGTLKLFFGADPAELAAQQIPLHEAKKAEYEMTAKLEMDPGMRLALELGIKLETEYLRFWEQHRA